MHRGFKIDPEQATATQKQHRETTHDELTHFSVMHQEKCTLTWDTYQDHLKQVMQDMMMSEEFADVTLVSDDKKTIRAHRNILSACSPVFKDILQMETQNHHPVIYLRGIQYSEIESILQFMYLGQANFHQERMSKVIMVAKNLKIKELSKGIELNESYPDDVKENSNKSSINKDETEKNDSEQQADDESAHEGLKYFCNQCDYQATQQKSLKIHIQSKHEGVKYACDQCEYQATTQSNLTQHNEKGVEYACKQCCYEPDSSIGLRHHIRFLEI